MEILFLHSGFLEEQEAGAVEEDLWPCYFGCIGKVFPGSFWPAVVAGPLWSSDNQPVSRPLYLPVALPIAFFSSFRARQLCAF